MPSQTPKYQVYGNSNIGLVRKKNEDSFLINKQLDVFAVADGLGGLPYGDLASQAAIQELENQFKSLPDSQPPNYFEIVRSIKNAVIKKSIDLKCDFGIATTLTTIKLIEKTLHIAHVGDSGLFVFRKDLFTKLTTDHTMAQEMRHNADSENIYIPEYYNHILTECIGSSRDIHIEQKTYQVDSGDRLLLYTDGITKAFKQSELHNLSFKYDSPKDFVDHLISECNIRGGTDNATAIALFFDFQN